MCSLFELRHFSREDSARFIASTWIQYCRVRIVLNVSHTPLYTRACVLQGVLLQAALVALYK